MNAKVRHSCTSARAVNQSAANISEDKKRHGKSEATESAKNKRDL